MRKSRRFLGLIMVLVLTLIASACSSSSTSTKSSTTDSSKPVTLKFLRLGDPKTVKPIFDPLIQEFQKENPNIKVEQITMGFDEANTKIPLMASTGTLPDVFFTTVNFGYDLAKKNKIIPLSSYINKTPSLKKDLFPSVWDAVKFNNDTFWVPSGVAPIQLWYNTKLFKQAGLDPNNPPTTLDELVKDAQQITEKTGVPGLGIHATASDDMTSIVQSLYQSFSGTPIWDAKKNQLTVKDHKDSMAKAIQYMDDLVNKYKVTESNVEEQTRFTLRPQFRDGKVAMVFDGIWIKSTIAQQINDGSIKPAAFPAGDKGSFPVIGTDGWAIAKNSKNPDAAWKLIQFLMKTENQSKHDSQYGLVPVLASEMKMPDYNTDFWKTIVKAEKSGYGRIANQNVSPLELMLANEAQGVIVKKQTAKDAVDHMISKAKDISQ